MIPWTVVPQQQATCFAISYLFRASPRESFSVTSERHGFRNLIPQSAYRQRVFTADLPIFELRCITIPFDDSASSSSIDGRAIRLPLEGNALRTFYVCALLAKHAAWGAIDLVFRIFHAGDLFLSFHTEKRFLSLVIPLRRHFFVVSSRTALKSGEHHATHLTMKKFCWLVSHIDGVLEGSNTLF